MVVTLITQYLYMKVTKRFSYLCRKNVYKKYLVKPIINHFNKHQFCKQIIFLFFSLFLFNLYSSAITSSMIIPPDDKAFTTITGFSENKVKVNLLIMKEFEFVVDKYRNISLPSYNQHSADFNYVAKLVPNLSYALYGDYLSKMISNTENILLSVFEWHWAIHFFTILNKIIFKILK